MPGNGSGGVATLEARARRATVVLWLFIVAQFCTPLLIGGSYAGLLTPADADGVASLISLIPLLLSMIFVGMWIHRAHANLFEAGLDGLSYSRAGRWAGFSYPS